MDLLTHRAGADRHRAGKPGELVHPTGVRAGDVHHDRCRQGSAVRQRDPGDPVAPAVDAHHRSAEPELCSQRLGRVLQVAAGQLGVADVARVRHPHGACERCTGLRPELLAVDRSRRPHLTRVQQRQPSLDLGCVPVLVRDAELVEQRHHLGGMPARCVQQGHPAGNELREVAVVRTSEVAAPVAPVVQALPGHRDPGDGGVAEPHDGTRVARRPVAGPWKRVQVQRETTAARQLVGERRADHPRSDDHHVGRALTLRDPGCGHHWTPTTIYYRYVGIIGKDPV